MVYTIGARPRLLGTNEYRMEMYGTNGMIFPLCTHYIVVQVCMVQLNMVHYVYNIYIIYYIYIS